MKLALKELIYNKKKYILIELIITLLVFMVLFLTGLVEGLGRTVISGIDNIDADYFLLSDSAEKLITVSDLDTDKYDELRSQTDAETAVLGIQRMYLSKKGSDEKLNITYFVIEPGSFLEPEIDLSYIDEKGEKRRPIMIHRVCFGSVERFIGTLIEHYGGRFPFWLAPLQVKVLTVSKSAFDYAEEVYEKFKAAGIRCQIDARNEKLGYMIREAQYKERVPYMVIIGEKEKTEGNVSVRFRDKEGIETFELETLISELVKLKRDRD